MVYSRSALSRADTVSSQSGLEVSSFLQQEDGAFGYEEFVLSSSVEKIVCKQLGCKNSLDLV